MRRLPAIRARRSARATSTVALALCVVAGGAEGQKTTDSAGVGIVVFEKGVLQSVPPRPLVAAHGDGGAQHKLSADTVDVTAALLSQDGRITVANSATSALHLFSDRGETVVAANGDAPNRFEHHRLLVSRCAGDSLILYDERLYYLQLHAPNGDKVRERMLSVEVSREMRPPQRSAPGAFDDCSVLAARKLTHTDIVQQLFTDTISFARISLRNDSVQTIGYLRNLLDLARDVTMPARQRDGPAVMVNFGTSITAVAPTSRADFVAADGNVVHSFNDRTGELLTFDRSGKLLRRIASGLVPNEQMNADEDARPVLLGLLVDFAGSVWIEERRATTDTLATWTVLSSTGASLGRYTIPATFRVWAAGTNELLVSSGSGREMVFTTFRVADSQFASPIPGSPADKWYRQFLFRQPLSSVAISTSPARE